MLVFLMVLLLFSPETSSLEESSPEVCNVPEGCNAFDNAMLFQAAFMGNRASPHGPALNQQGLSTSNLIEKVTEMMDQIMSGEMKITNSTRIILKTIDVQMDVLVEGIVASYKGFQSTVDRARDAFVRCTNETTRRYAEVGGLDSSATVMNSASDAHNTCRGEEVTLKQAEVAVCTSLDAFLAGLTLPQCSSFTVEDLGTEGFKDCAVAMSNWATHVSETFDIKERICKNATAAHESKRTSCNTMQATFEADFCHYDAALVTTCHSQDECRSEQIKLRNMTHTRVAKSEVSLKAEYESAKHVKCLLDVMNATDVEKPLALADCVAHNVDSTHLNIKYYSVPAAAACDLSPVATKPCDQYQREEWIKDVPAEACNSCPEMEEYR